MSTAQSRPPGVRGRRSARIARGVTELVLQLVALGLLVVGLQDLVSTGSSIGRERFWMVVVGIPLLAPGGWWFQTGFRAAGRRRSVCDSGGATRAD